MAGSADVDGDVLLSVRDLSVHYGGVKAVDGVDLDVPAGRVVGLIGPNGAGKTSLLDGVSGFVRTRGTVMLEGTEIQRLAAHKRVRVGLARTFQTTDPLRDLSTEDLIRISTTRRSDGGEGGALLPEVLNLLKLGDLASKSLSELPAGLRRLVTVASAVATEPRVLMLDEPAAGLSSEETGELTQAIHLLRDNGVGVLVVDHNVGFVSRTCDWISAMHLGKTIFTGTPEAMHESPEVASVYLGDVVAPR